MSVEDILATLGLPPNVGPEREKAILQAVLDDKAEVVWADISNTYKDHTATFHVFADALKISGVRVNVSAETEQHIADAIGCMLLTPLLADLMWVQAAVHIEPRPRPITASTQAMVEHSLDIDKQLAALGNPTGLIQTVGKHWVIDEPLASNPSKAMNYGWHFKGAAFQGLHGEVVASLMKDASGAYLRLIQGRGTAHDMHHSDYSQTCCLVARECEVDGGPADLEEILKDPELAPLASASGKLSVLRQPGVEIGVIGATVFGTVPST